MVEDAERGKSEVSPERAGKADRKEG